MPDRPECVTDFTGRQPCLKNSDATPIFKTGTRDWPRTADTH